MRAKRGEAALEKVLQRRHARHARRLAHHRERGAHERLLHVVIERRADVAR